MKNNSSSFIVYISIVLAVTFWGFSFIWTNALLIEGLAPFTLILFRLLFASVILFTISLSLKKLQKIKKEDLKWFLLLVILEPFFYFIDETHDWKRKTITNYTTREMQVPIFKNGKLVYKVPTLNETRKYAQSEMERLYPEARRLLNPHVNYVTLSKELLKLKKDMIYEAKRKTEEKEQEKESSLQKELKNEKK
jgi:hypothetical protein